MSQANNPHPSWRNPLLMGFLFVFSSVAMAQWQWVDGTGRKVFSDTPPPASIPDKSILKRPGAMTSPPLVSAEPLTAEPTTNAPPAPQIPARDTELETKKKQAEQAEEAKKKAEQERVAKARAETCERARKAKITMESGVRLATTNAKGEREVMDDKAKAAESQRLDAIIRSDCGPK